LAIVAAVLMIAGGFYLRTRTNATDEAKNIEAGKVTGTLVCAVELRTTCDELRASHPDLEIRYEEAGTTATKLEATTFNHVDGKIDAWLVPKAFPAMVNDNRSRSSLEPAIDDPSKVLARSPAVIVAFRDRVAALAKRCGVADDQVNWKCIGENAGTSWADLGTSFGGEVRPGYPVPDQSATGLLVLAQAAAEQVGRADFARNDLDEPGFQAWLAQLERSIRQPSAAQTPLQVMLSQGVSQYQFVGSLEAFAGPTVPVSRDKDKLRILYPSPVTTADLVVVPVRGSDKGARVKQLIESGVAASSLAKAGWRVEGQPAIDGVGNAALPEGDGLASPGALIALIEEWNEVK